MAAPDSSRTRRRRAERARTELADPAADALLYGTWRDWANLTDGPAGLIAERALADDVATYLRFRAVCVSWRRSTSSPHAHDILDRRFHPRRWIMLPEVFATQLQRRDFLNVSSGERIRVDIPELRDQFVFVGHTPDGLILLCQKNTTGDVRLLNPLTRHLTALPNAASIKSPWSAARIKEFIESRSTFHAGLANSSTLALHYDLFELAVAKPNADERWSRSTHFGYCTYSTLSFENRFYCFTEKGLMVVDLTGGAGQQPRLEVALKVDENFFRASQRYHLVDNGGELILVRRNYVPTNPNKYEVYFVDLDKGKMVPMLGLHGRALFVCHDWRHRRALSVHADLSSSISADYVYECHEECVVGEDRRPVIHAYDLWQGSLTKPDFFDYQGSILDYLSRYVCGSENGVVPGRGKSRLLT